MRNTPYEGYKGIRMPKDLQIQRIRRVIEEELTSVQRAVIIAYYIENKTMEEIALDRAVCRSTVCRTLHRAEDKLRRYLKY